MAMFGKSVAANAVDSALAGGVFLLADKLISKSDSMDLKKGALAAASAFGGEFVGRTVLPMVANWGTFSGASLQQFGTPAIAGGIYSLSSGPLGIDNRDMLTKFLMAAGSTAVAQYVALPVEGLILGK